MTIYTTDFSEYTTDVDLSDWSTPWSSNVTYEAETNSDTLKVGTKKCVIDNTGGSGTQMAIVWDDIGTVSDSDIITRIEVVSTYSGYPLMVMSRVSGSTSSENAYVLEIKPDYFNIVKLVSGVRTVLTPEDFDCEFPGYYWVRLQTIGTTIRAKIWAEDAIEPAEWKATVTDSDLTSGECGVGSNTSIVDFEVDYFSCGTGTDSAVFPPIGYELLDKFSTVGTLVLSAGMANSTRSMGGLFEIANKALVGIQIVHGGHTTDLRIAVYSGGDLTTGLNNATLLHDFGVSASSTSPLEMSCSAVDIPVDEPLWIVVKSDGAGFTIQYTDDDVNSGNYQMARGRCAVGSIIGYDTSVAFPATFPDTNGVFTNYWYGFIMLLEDVETQVATPVMDPASGSYPTDTTVSLTCTTGSSTIYYTTDGSTPDNTDTEYTTPITISEGMNIKAIATASGLDDSEIASETYTIGDDVQQPMIFIIT